MVKKADKAEREHGSDNRLGKFGEVTKEDPDVAADKTECESMKLSNVCDDINRNGIHAEPKERLRPAAEIPDLDDLKEDREENCGKSASDENVGGGPEELDYGKLEGPNQTESET